MSSSRAQQSSLAWKATYISLLSFSWLVDISFPAWEMHDPGVLDAQLDIILQLHESFYTFISCDMTGEEETASPWQQQVI